MITIVLCHNGFVTHIKCSAKEALSLRDQLKHGEHCPPKVYSDYEEISWDDLAYEEAQVYCDVCGANYHVEDPCPFH